MEKVTIKQAQKYTSPNPITLICTEKPDGTTNLAAVSWWTYISNSPPMLCFSMGNKSYSGELVKSQGKVLLAIPGAELAEQAFQCGCMSGRDRDKAAELKIEMLTPDGIGIQAPTHSKLIFRCSLENTMKAGDDTVYLCNIDDIFYIENEKQLYAWEGYSRLRTL